MLVNKTNLEIAKFASTDVTRPSLNGVHITPKGTEATDGTQAIRVSAPQLDPSEFPECPLDPAKPVESALLPTPVALDVAKRIPRKSNLPIIQNAVVEADSEEIRLHTTDLDFPADTRSRHCDGTYPNIDAVWPTEEPALYTHVNGKRLGALLTWIGSKAEGEASRVELRIPNDPKKAIELRAVTAEGQEIAAILMPLIMNQNYSK